MSWPNQSAKGDGNPNSMPSNTTHNNIPNNVQYNASNPQYPYAGVPLNPHFPSFNSANMQQTPFMPPMMMGGGNAPMGSNYSSIPIGSVPPVAHFSQNNSFHGQTSPQSANSMGQVSPSIGTSGTGPSMPSGSPMNMFQQQQQQQQQQLMMMMMSLQQYNPAQMQQYMSMMAAQQAYIQSQQNLSQMQQNSPTSSNPATSTANSTPVSMAPMMPMMSMMPMMPAGFPNMSSSTAVASFPDISQASAQQTTISPEVMPQQSEVHRRSSSQEEAIFAVNSDNQQPKEATAHKLEAHDEFDQKEDIFGSFIDTELLASTLPVDDAFKSLEVTSQSSTSNKLSQHSGIMGSDKGAALEMKDNIHQVHFVSSNKEELIPATIQANSVSGRGVNLIPITDQGSTNSNTTDSALQTPFNNQVWPFGFDSFNIPISQTTSMEQHTASKVNSASLGDIVSSPPSMLTASQRAQDVAFSKPTHMVAGGDFDNDEDWGDFEVAEVNDSMPSTTHTASSQRVSSLSSLPINNISKANLQSSSAEVADDAEEGEEIEVEVEVEVEEDVEVEDEDDTKDVWKNSFEISKFPNTSTSNNNVDNNSKSSGNSGSSGSIDEFQSWPEHEMDKEINSEHQVQILSHDVAPSVGDIVSLQNLNGTNKERASTSELLERDAVIEKSKPNSSLDFEDFFGHLNLDADLAVAFGSDSGVLGDITGRESLPTEADKNEGEKKTDKEETTTGDASIVLFGEDISKRWKHAQEFQLKGDTNAMVPFFQRLLERLESSRSDSDSLNSPKSQLSFVMRKLSALLAQDMPQRFTAYLNRFRSLSGLATLSSVAESTSKEANHSTKFNESDFDAREDIVNLRKLFTSIYSNHIENGLGSLNEGTFSGSSSDSTVSEKNSTSQNSLKQTIEKLEDELLTAPSRSKDPLTMRTNSIFRACFPEDNFVSPTVKVIKQVKDSLSLGSDGQAFEAACLVLMTYPLNEMPKWASFVFTLVTESINQAMDHQISAYLLISLLFGDLRADLDSCNRYERINRTVSSVVDRCLKQTSAVSEFLRRTKLVLSTWRADFNAEERVVPDIVDIRLVSENIARSKPLFGGLAIAASALGVVTLSARAFMDSQTTVRIGVGNSEHNPVADVLAKCQYTLDSVIAGIELNQSSNDNGVIQSSRSSGSVDDINQNKADYVTLHHLVFESQRWYEEVSNFINSNSHPDQKHIIVEACLELHNALSHLRTLVIPYATRHLAQVSIERIPLLNSTMLARAGGAREGIEKEGIAHDIGFFSSLHDPQEQDHSSNDSEVSSLSEFVLKYPPQHAMILAFNEIFSAFNMFRSEDTRDLPGGLMLCNNTYLPRWTEYVAIESIRQELKHANRNHRIGLRPGTGQASAENEEWISLSPERLTVAVRAVTSRLFSSRYSSQGLDPRLWENFKSPVDRVLLQANYQ